MLKINNDGSIHCSRGDSGAIALRLPYMDNNGYYKYQDNDDPVNYYWYDKDNDKVYTIDYTPTSVSISTLTQVKYIFQNGDYVDFVIYNKNGYTSEPLKQVHVDITEPSDVVTIPFSDETTTVGDIANKPVTYWYDITLNTDKTVVCYNENGAKEFISYPAIGDEE